MPAQPNFFWDYLPFWVLTYGLAVLAWTFIGRFLLGLWLPPNSSNYIWRFFRRLTDWPLVVVSAMTPRIIGPHFTLLAAAYWCFALRYIVFIVFWTQGWAPSLTPAAAAS